MTMGGPSHGTYIYAIVLHLSTFLSYKSSDHFKLLLVGVHPGVLLSPPKRWTEATAVKQKIVYGLVENIYNMTLIVILKSLLFKLEKCKRIIQKNYHL